jgi:hypothetical protein
MGIQERAPLGDTVVRESGHKALGQDVHYPNLGERDTHSPRPHSTTFFILLEQGNRRLNTGQQKSQFADS